MRSGLSLHQKIIKRSFDILFSTIGLIVAFPIIFLSWFIATIETKSNGIFFQKRIGQHGKTFYLFKIKTMNDDKNNKIKITVSNDPRITQSGIIFRKYKIDELPQLFNVLIGDMSFVGPRPDVEGYADKLSPEDKIILSIKPGITGPASIKYSNEEEILAKVDNPKIYNDEIIWPDKVTINIDYINRYSFFKDIRYIFETILK